MLDAPQVLTTQLGNLRNNPQSHALVKAAQEVLRDLKRYATNMRQGSKAAASHLTHQSDEAFVVGSFERFITNTQKFTDTFRGLGAEMGFFLSRHTFEGKEPALLRVWDDSIALHTVVCDSFSKHEKALGASNVQQAVECAEEASGAAERLTAKLTSLVNDLPSLIKKAKEK